MPRTTREASDQEGTFQGLLQSLSHCISPYPQEEGKEDPEKRDGVLSMKAKIIRECSQCFIFQDYRINLITNEAHI